MIENAVIFATAAHKGQKRKGTEIPYILHPLEAANIVLSYKYDEELISAAILHDILEETTFTKKDIEAQFGSRVAELVEAETEDKSKTWEERKAHTIEYLEHTQDKGILIVTLGDKLSNVRAIHRDYLALGDRLWDRFNKGKELQRWYYIGLVKSLYLLEDVSAYQEFKRLVEDVFIQPRLNSKT